MMLDLFRKGRLVAMTLFLLLPSFVWAQGSRGSITGVVKDSTGAVVPNVTVKVTQTTTGIAYNGETQANGAYFMPNLNPGTYTVTVEAKGFKKLTVDNLKVDVATTLTQDLVLQVGQVSETVEVTATSNLVETTSNSVGTTINQTQVMELVIPDRNIFNLVNLTPGAWANTSKGRGMQVSLGGGRNQTQRATIDGIDNTRGGNGVNNVEMTVPVESVQEFRVQTNNMSAEHGFSGGGVLNVVTRSGSNQFHGSLYEFIRNDKFDAVGWGNTTKQKLRRNNYGAAIGGPIRKDHTFFFFNWDKMKSITANTQFFDVGLPEWRTGNFSTARRDAGGSGVAVPIYDPETGTGTFTRPLATLLFPGNVIPTSRLDPVAVKMLALYPTANRPANNSFNQQGNFAENLPANSYENYYIGRIDHELTSKTKMYGRYIITGPYGNDGGESPSGAWGGYGRKNKETNRQQHFVLNFTHLFSPTFFANVTTGFFRWRQTTQAGCSWCGVDYASQVGFTGTYKGDKGTTLPNMGLGTGTVPLSSLGGGPDRFANGTHSTINADFTKIRGPHTWKFGFAFDKLNNNMMNNQSGAGQFSFDGHYTRGVDANGVFINNTGINMADFLLGRITTGLLAVMPPLGRRSFHTGAYFQDDWRVSSRLTLNIGMRWDTQNPVHAVDDRYSNFNPNLVSPLAGTGDIPAGARGVMEFQGRNGLGTYLWNWDKKTFGPRFGFAWRMFGTNETVLRGGYGIFFGPPLTAGADGAGTSGLNGGGTLGFGANWTVNDPAFRLRDGIPAGSTLSPPRSAWTPEFGQRGTPYAQSAMFFYDKDGAYPYTQNVNLTLQHQWKETMFEIGYLGSFVRHAPGYAQNMNLIPQSLLARTDIPERLKRPYTILTGDNSSVTDLEPRWGISNYNAMALRIEKRTRVGLNLSFAYTWSKVIDDVSVQTAFAWTWGDNNQPQNPYDRRNERSLSVNHIPHRAVFSPVYELPFGSGRKFLNQGGVVSTLR